MIPEYCDFVIEGGRMWYSDCRFNGLFCQSVENGTVEFIGFFPDEKLGQRDLYRQVLLLGKELVFIPSYAKNICIYHLENQSFTNYKIPDIYRRTVYVSAIQENDEIYMFPAYAGKAILFDVAKRKITELYEFNVRFADLLKQSRQKFYYAGIESNGGWAYLSVVGSNQIIAYHLSDRKVISHIFRESERLGSIAVHKNSVYISLLGENCILCWKPHTGEEKRIYYRISFADQQREFLDCPILKIFGKNIYLYFGKYMMLGKIPLLMNKVEEVTVLENNIFAYTLIQKNQYLFFIPYNGNVLYRYDAEKEKGYSIISNWENAKETRWDILFKKGIDVVPEEIESSEKDCVQMVLQYRRYVQRRREQYCVGKKIWDMLR